MKLNIMKISTPDLCDEYESQLRVLDPLFRNLGGKESFYGEVVHN